MNTIESTPFKPFDLGNVCMTQGVKDLFDDNLSLLVTYLQRYQCGDWGDTCAEDAELNNESIHDGYRIFAVYHYNETRFWIITEADRHSTTALLPEEY